MWIACLQEGGGREVEKMRRKKKRLEGRGRGEGEVGGEELCAFSV
jgi:hypothetical protein